MPRPGFHKWTPEEIAVLEARYPNEFASDIAKALGLHARQVSFKAHALGLGKTDAFEALRREKSTAHLRIARLKSGYIS